MPQYQGVWTLEQQAQAQSNQQWVTDPNFKNTTLLLQADGTGSGSQNNTFLDGSTNNFFITRNGNTTQGSFSPFSQAPGYWGNFFPTSSFFTVPNNAVFNLGSNNFTIECWYYQTANNTGASLISQWQSANDANSSWQLMASDSTNTPQFTFNVTSPVSITSSVATALNTWNHLAAVRNGGTITLYLNGVSVASSSVSGSIRSVTNPVGIAARGGSTGDSQFPNGYISNARVVNGTAVYTAAFTPQTTPLTAITNTVLLTSQSNRFVDNSTTASAITIGGTSSVQAFSPFAPALQWTPDVVGGSGYFDGTGDYLQTPDNAALDLSGDFTVEAWVYVPNVSGEKAVFHNHTSDNNGIAFVVNGASIRVGSGSGGFWNVLLDSSNTITANSWNHIAATRSGNTYTVWVNGVSGGTATSSVTPTYSGGAQIGRFTSGLPLAFNGYMFSFRVVKGTAVYTSNFTPSTTPLTAITNTSLLLNYTNAGIYDGKMANNLETVGNAQVATSPVKYGSGSIFAGPAAADYVLFPYSPNLNFGAGDFTIECWLFWTGGTSENTLIMNNASGGVNLALTNSGTWQIGTSYVAWQNDFGTTPTKNTWNHLAVSRNGTVIKAFINGVQIYVGTNSTNYTNTSTWYIAGNGAAAIGLIGYVDDFRISRFARYFTTFTPPQQALPRQ